ncbi:MAG: Cna B-type domain-containing protein, partial [Lachnospiraceae bacterium]|nr:Cna B-type domain-containing protein [Lachnospiraceae bacterium]
MKRNTSKRNRILAMVLTLAMVFQQAGITSLAEDGGVTAEATTTEAAVTAGEDTSSLEEDAAEAGDTVSDEDTAVAAGTDEEEDSSDAEDEALSTEETTEEVTEASEDAETESENETADTEEAETEETEKEETESELETDTEQETELETELFGTSFTYTDPESLVVITATASTNAEIPQDAELQVEYLDPDSDTYKAAYASAVETIETDLSKALGLGETGVQAAYVLYDVSFVYDGIEIEPQDEVTITVTYDEDDLMDLGLDGEPAARKVVQITESGNAVVVAGTAYVNEDGFLTGFMLTSDGISVVGAAVTYVTAEEAESDCESDAGEEAEETETDTEIEAESESETEASTEEETEASKTEFEYADERVIITATATEKANFPQDAELKADYLDPDSDEYKAAVAEFNAQLSTELGADDENVVVEYTLYDIYFLCTSTGERIEPEEGKVTVSMTFIEPVATEAVGEVISTEVVHLKNDGEAEIVTDYVNINSEGEVTSVGFTSDSFSFFGVGNARNTADATTITNVTYENATYDGSEYTANLTINFTVDVATLTSNNLECSFSLPEGISPPSSYNGETLYGNDSNGKRAFTYVYVQDKTTGIWTAEITFLRTYDFGDNTEVNCYVSFWATIDSSLRQNDDSLMANFEDSVTLTIPASKITTGDNYTPDNDISVSKSSSGYDVTTNTITYMVTVSTTKGTGSDISLSDILTATGVTIKRVVLDSVTYYDMTDEYNTSNASDVISSCTFAYDGSSTVTMTLPELTVTSGNYGSKYVITYTVTLDSSAGTNISGTVDNKATGTSKSDWDGGYDIEDSGEKEVDVSVNLLSKSGYANSDGTITWTITVNSSNIDISGYQLLDDMLADAISGTLSVSPDSNYEYITTAAGITGIKFTGSPNTSKYTITFKTQSSATLAASTTETNSAELKDDSGDSKGSASTDVTVNGGSVSKTYNNATDNGDNTVTLNWTSTVTIPAGGIAAGTEIGDYLGGDGYETTTNQWFTSTQITKLLSSYYNGTLTIGDQTLTSANDDYSIKVYSVTSRKWVDYSEISSYSSDKFTAFVITIKKDVNLSAETTLTFTYNTIADKSEIVKGNETSIIYYNKFWAKKDTTLSSTAWHTEYTKVLKTDGNGNVKESDTNNYTSIDTSDGVLTWKVKFLVPAGATESDYVSFTVTDTLPENVTLTSAKVEANGQSVTLTETNGSLSGILNGGEIDGTITTSGSNKVVTITIPWAVYSALASSTDGGYVTITYTCQIDSSKLQGIVSGASLGEYKNSVKVTYNNSTEYGSAEQTQKVTYKENTGTSETISKSASWDKLNSQMDYSVLVNPEAADLLAGSSYLDFVDNLIASADSSSGIYASLIHDSVVFYELVEAVSNNGDYMYTDNGVTYNYNTDSSKFYVSDSGTVYYIKGTLGIAWSYSANVTSSATYHYITASIPDETVILVQYSYRITAVNKEDFSQGLTNTVKISGGYSDTTSGQWSDKYDDAGYSAGVLAKESLTLLKVDSSNNTEVLDGAVYTLYVYDDSVDSGTYKWNDTGLTFTTVNGSFTVTAASLGTSDYEDKLYKLVETNAPSGYILDSDTEYYFYWKNKGTVTVPDGFDLTSAYDLTASAETVYASNTAYTSTEMSETVTKIWQDENGNKITSNYPESVIEVGLYQSALAVTDAVKITVVKGDSYNEYNNVTVKTLYAPKGYEATVTLSAASGTIESNGVFYEVSGGNIYYGNEIATAANQVITLNARDMTGNIVIYYELADSSSVLGDITISCDTADATGSTLVNTAKLRDSNNWSYAWTGLDYMSYDGTYWYFYTYSVKEITTGDFETSYAVSGNTTTITNKQVTSMSITVEKEWKDSSGTSIDVTDPSEVEVKLYRSSKEGETVSNYTEDPNNVVTISVILNVDGTVTYSKKLTVQKNKAVEVVIEGTPGQYGGAFSACGANGAINNNLDSNYYSITGVGGSKLTIELKAEVVSEDITISAKYYSLTLNENNIIITSAASGTGSGSTKTEQSVTDELVGTYTIKYADGWTLTIDNLPKYYVVDNGDGTSTKYNYTYTFAEVSVGGYETSYSANNSVSTDGQTVTITNKDKNEKTSVTVVKTWSDSNLVDHSNDKVTVELYKNGSATGQT